MKDRQHSTQRGCGKKSGPRHPALPRAGCGNRRRCRRSEVFEFEDIVRHVLVTGVRWRQPGTGGTGGCRLFGIKADAIAEVVDDFAPSRVGAALVVWGHEQHATRDELVAGWRL